MKIFEEKTVVENIKENYDQIFMAEKKVADFILANPERAVNANVSELANLSDVSDATVIRLCKRIGYQGYYQLRISLSRDLGSIMGKDYQEQQAVENTVKGLFQNFAYQLTAIGKQISDDKMQQCVNLIKSCNYVHLVAVGNTSTLAKYMGFRLGRLGIRCTYNDLPEYFLNHVNLAQKDDIVFAISQSGSSRSVVQALELAKEKGLKIIAVVGCEYSPISRLADCLLLSVSEEQTFDYYKNYSHLKETAVIDAILHFVTDEDKIKASSANTPEIILSETKM
jgi:DNA-binding MurR/RpiR family transcriptional regulator